MLNSIGFNRKAKQRIRDYDAVFSTEAGQRVLADLMLKFHMRESEFHDNDRVHAHNSGERNVVLYILTTLAQNDPAYWRKLTELPAIDPSMEQED